MIDKWFRQDIDALFKEHKRVVVSDKGGNGRFLVDTLHDYNVIEAGSELEELHARYDAEKNYADKPVVFYATMGQDKLCYLLEYAETGGVVALDNLPQYITNKIWQHLHENPKVDGATLVTAAKLSKGNDENWWRKVAEGLEEPFSVHENLISFLLNPTAYKERGADIYRLLVEKIDDLTSLADTGQSPEVLASCLMKCIFDRLLDNTLTGPLDKLYDSLTKMSNTRQVVMDALSDYKLPDGVDFRKVSPDHCFVKIDESMMHELANAITERKSTKEYVDYLSARLKSDKAIDYKPNWLKDVKEVLTFSAAGIKSLSSLEDCAVYYRDHFSRLDADMRHIFVAWLSNPKVLRPIQYLYEQYEKELLDKWFTFADQYQPNQYEFIEKVLRKPGRTAVIVGDGLRLSIVETIRRNFRNKNVKIEPDMLYAALPSVTENGMSELYGCHPKTKNAEERRQHLSELIENVEIMDADALNDSVTAQKLVLLFSDIDQLGEKKQLGALKDIDQYEKILNDKIQSLIEMGYQHVYVTTDHGFVLTGILDDSDKQEVPSQPVQKVEERFILADELLDDNKLIGRKDDFFGYKYQYYAKTDRPFSTKGKYGYAHGGFTPQECVIPAYDFHVEDAGNQLKVSISNKSELADVAGDSFDVKLHTEGDATNVFASSRKIKVVVFAGSKQTQKSPTIEVQAGKSVQPIEFDVDENDKVVVIDAETKEQLDSASIKKSSVRDLGGLL
jgi:PglZ domain.